MPCIPFRQGNATGFVCTTRTKPSRCKCGSGLPADLLCDWKTPEGPKPTCDAKLCARCTHKPKGDKDLCQKHATEWKARLAARSGAPT